ncbi:MAG TPA: hypothetical protein VMC09_06165 [Anaerolineales bacterium]|nr:hypothetical protein [Anaerolineales bacterium]
MDILWHERGVLASAPTRPRSGESNAWRPVSYGPDGASIRNPPRRTGADGYSWIGKAYFWPKAAVSVKSI